MNAIANFGMPRKGDFQHFTVCGPFEPRLDDMLDLRGYHGVVPEAFYTWGTMRDEAGNTYTFARRVPYGPPPAISEKGDQRKAMGRRLMFQTNRGHAGLVLDMDRMRAAGTSEDPVVQRRDGQVELLNGPNPRGKNWALRVTEKSLGWDEHDVFSIESQIIWPGLQWYLIDRDESTYYCSLMFEAKGRILGEPVQGFIFLEQAFLAEGGMLYAHRDTLVGKGCETTWYTFATRWDDGTVEAGHFIAGHDRLGFAMATDGKKLTMLTSNVSAEVTRAADGYWHEGIRVSANGELWEMVPDPRGRLLNTNKMPNPQQEGLVRRIGEKRKPVSWCAWGETAPGHGNRGRNRYAI